jgi:hypothetical protein
MTLDMTIGSVSFSNAGAAHGASGHLREPKPPAMDNTAEALGLSTDDLQNQLKSGTTLDDIAKAQGVSSDDLLKALKSDLTANKPAGVPSLSDDQLTEIATSIAAGKGPQGPGGPVGSPPPRGKGGDGSSTDTNLATLADGLGISSAELIQKLQQGFNTSSLWGSSTPNAYTSSKYNVAGGVAVDTYA